MDASVDRITRDELLELFAARWRTWESDRRRVAVKRTELGEAVVSHQLSLSLLNEATRELNRRREMGQSSDQAVLAVAEAGRNVVVRDPDPLTEVAK